MRSMFAGGFPGGGQGGFGGGFGGRRRWYDAGGFDISDLFGDLFNRGGGGGGGFGGTRARAPRAAKGADLETETTLSFTDAIDGTTISMRLSSDAPCPTCNGTGGKPGTRPHVCGTCDGAGVVISSVGGGFSMNETCPECHGRQLVYDESCPTCHGSGRGLSSRTVSARIPAGVKDGQRIRLKGKGAAGENGGPDGDLFVTVHVSRPPALRPQGRQPHPRGAGHLRRGRPRAPRSRCRPSDGAAGHAADPGRARPTGGSCACAVAGATRKDGSRGDLLVTVDVQVPAQLDDATRAAVTAYRDARTRQRCGDRPAGRPVPGDGVMGARAARTAVRAAVRACPGRPCPST